MSLVVHHRKLTNYVAFTTITENVYYDSHYDVWIEICLEFRIVGSCFCFLFSLSCSHISQLYDIPILQSAYCSFMPDQSPACFCFSIF